MSRWNMLKFLLAAAAALCVGGAVGFSALVLKLHLAGGVEHARCQAEVRAGVERITSQMLSKNPLAIALFGPKPLDSPLFAEARKEGERKIATPEGCQIVLKNMRENEPKLMKQLAELERVQEQSLNLLKESLGRLGQNAQ